MSKIKICGLTSMTDIEIVNQGKPDYVGFIFAPSRRQISLKQAEKFAGHLHSSVKAIGVFVNNPVEEIEACLKKGLIHGAQLHGNETEDMITYLKRKMGKVIIKAVSVQSVNDIIQWQSSEADYLLFDNGKGGTGSSFSWGILKEAGRQQKPFFLAGGLAAHNIERALAYTPYCVDISSGVETDGKKDSQKINELILKVRSFQSRNGRI